MSEHKSMGGGLGAASTQEREEAEKARLERRAKEREEAARIDRLKDKAGPVVEDKAVRGPKEQPKP